MIAHKNSCLTFAGFVLHVIRFISSTFGDDDIPTEDTIGLIMESDFPPVHSTQERTRNFVSIYKDVNQAVRKFMDEFEWLHQTSIISMEVHSEEDDYQQETGSGSTHGTLQLKFWYSENDEIFGSSVLVKVPQLGARYMLGKQLLVYVKEKYMYETILPCMFPDQSREQLVPNFYSVTDSGVLVIGNLREIGFFKKDDSAHDLPMCTQVLKTLAEFHALSIARVDYATAGVLDHLSVTDRGSVIADDKVYHIIVEKLRERLMPALEKDTRDELEDMIRNVNLVMQLAFLPNVPGLNVILHGDPSMTNVFFRSEDEDNLTLVCKFVDFQHSRRGSPVIDVLNYLMTSVHFDTIRTEVDMLVRYYVDEFASALEELEVNVDDQMKYGIDELKADLRKYKMYFIFKLAFVIPQYQMRVLGISSSKIADRYDRLFESEMYVSFFKDWMNVLQ